MAKGRWGYGRFIAALVIPAAAWSQEKPLTVNGTFSTGYYSTSTRGEANQLTSFVPVGAKFEMSGYYSSPELLSFSAQPEVNYGPQASDAGFQGGNGIRLGVTVLSKSITPLTFRYSNLQAEDVYFGSLSQVSGYSLKERNKDLGFSWEFKPHGLPATTVDWGRGSVDSKSSLAGVGDYQSHGDHVNVDSKYQRWGWDLGGSMRRTNQDSDLLAAIDGTASVGTLREKVTQYQGTARRGFMGDSELYVDGGSQATSSLLFTLPIDLSARYVSANLRLTQRRRWKTLLRASYSTNLASQLLERAAGTLAVAGAAVPDGNILLPFSHGMANLNLNGLTTFTVGHGLGLYGSVERNAIYSYEQDPLNSQYMTSSAGVTYAGKFHGTNLSGEYGREYGRGSLIGQTGTIDGHRYSVSAGRGNSGLQVDGAIRGSDEHVHSSQPLSNSSVATEVTVGARVVADLSARLGGGWQWGSIVNTANEFRTDGYTARASIEHPRFQIAASLNNSLSNSLPLYDQLFGGLGLGSVLVTPQRAIPSDFRATSLTLHANPLKKMEISGSWTRSRQHLDGALSNTFELLNFYATYHFRRVQLEAGFTLSNQVFSLFPSTLRKRVYVRIVRNARIL